MIPIGAHVELKGSPQYRGVVVSDPKLDHQHEHYRPGPDDVWVRWENDGVITAGPPASLRVIPALELLAEVVDDV